MFKRIVGLFLFWKIILIIFALIAPLFLTIPAQNRQYLGNTIFPNAHYLNWIWANFDGARYLYTVENGYREFNFAFFPFLPFIIYLIHRIFNISPLIAGILINNLAFFASLFVVYKIILIDYNKKIAWSTLFFLAIFPVSFYYNSVYTESLYFLFATLSFYYARKSNWLPAGFLGYLAGLTRFVGIALFPALLIEWAQQNNFNLQKLKKKFFESKVFFTFLIPLAIVTYSIYLKIRFGDFLLFQKSMANWEQNKFVFPLQVLWRYFRVLVVLPNRSNFIYWVMILELIAVFLYFALSIYVWKKIRISYGAFMLISLIIPTCTGTFQSMPRYILHLFPAFLAIALLTEKNKLLFWGTAIIFLILGFIFTSLFTRGYFIG